MWLEPKPKTQNQVYHAQIFETLCIMESNVKLDNNFMMVCYKNQDSILKITILV